MPSLLPAPPMPRKPTPKTFAQRLLARVEEVTGGNQSEAARRLKVPLRTLQNWLGDRATPPDYVQRFVLEHPMSPLEEE